MINFCTLFDSNYLDRGLVLYRSLERSCAEFRLYILCMDETAFRALKELKLQKAVLIPEEDVLDDELRRLKTERSRAEYSWTCTPVVLTHVLTHFGADSCTYIDADMKFYSDPSVVLRELTEAKASIGIIGHRFPQNIAKEKRERYYGKYCVEFNTFRNDETGLKVLSDWKESCYRLCTAERGKESFGDQKYVEEWEHKFEGIYEYRHPGAGVAPWNLSDYRPETLDKRKLRLIYRGKIRHKLIFYHFQSFYVLGDGKYYIGVYNETGRKSKKLVDFLYTDYIADIEEARKELRKVGVTIPPQELRGGEKSAIRDMNLKDFLIFCWQCIPQLLEGRKNYVS